LGGIAATNAYIFASGEAPAQPRGAGPGGVAIPELLALFYPLYALFSAAVPEASFADVLGEGFSALGDLLGLAALIFGRFAILGLPTRRYTGLVAFAAWIVGLSLGSAPLTTAFAHLHQ
jgi:hypothetical protein